jgi:hypothetical protein
MVPYSSDRKIYSLDDEIDTHSTRIQPESEQKDEEYESVHGDNNEEGTEQEDYEVPANISQTPIIEDQYTYMEGLGNTLEEASNSLPDQTEELYESITENN